MRGRNVLPLVLVLLVLVIIVGGAYYFLTQQNNGQSLIPVVNNGGNGTQATAAPIVLTATPIELVEVVVALQDLPRGYRIPAYVTGSVSNAIDIQFLPKANVPSLAVTVDDPTNPQARQATLNKVVGKIARTDIARQSIILYTTIVDDLTAVAKVGSDAALVIPSGTRAITLPIDRLSGTAFALHDGDYIDVIGTFVYADVDQSFQSALPNKLNLITIGPDGQGGQKVTFLGLPSGRIENFSLEGFPQAVAVIPSESQRPRLTTQTIIQGAQVIHIGTFPLSGSFIGQTPTPIAPTAEPAQAGASTSGNATVAPSPTTALPDVITITVLPQEANVMAWMLDEHVPLTFTLHNPQDLGRANLQAVTLTYMIQNYGVVEPAGLPYGLEPPLRSIRSLTSSTLIPLSAPYGSGQAAAAGG